MTPRASLLIFVFAAALVVNACGGDSDSEPDATKTVDSSATADASSSATGSIDGSPTNVDGSSTLTVTGTESTDPAPPTQTPAVEATPAPPQDPERVKAFTNGILGEAQEPLFWMQLITGDIECGTNCPDSLDARWNRAATTCGEGRWEFRKSEDGYNEEIHGPLINALIESCGILGAKYSAGGTSDDSDEWREVANSALNILLTQFQILLESTLTAE